MFIGRNIRKGTNNKKIAMLLPRDNYCYYLGVSISIVSSFSVEEFCVLCNFLKIIKHIQYQLSFFICYFISPQFVFM